MAGKKSRVQQSLENIMNASMMALEIFGKHEKAEAWMTTKNDALFGARPLDSCVYQPEMVLSILREKLQECRKVNPPTLTEEEWRDVVQLDLDGIEQELSQLQGDVQGAQIYADKSEAQLSNHEQRIKRLEGEFLSRFGRC